MRVGLRAPAIRPDRRPTARGPRRGHPPPRPHTPRTGPRVAPVAAAAGVRRLVASVRGVTGQSTAADRSRPSRGLAHSVAGIP